MLGGLFVSVVRKLVRLLAWRRMRGLRARLGVRLLGLRWLVLIRIACTFSVRGTLRPWGLLLNTVVWVGLRVRVVVIVVNDCGLGPGRKLALLTLRMVLNSGWLGLLRLCLVSISWVQDVLVPARMTP